MKIRTINDYVEVIKNLFPTVSLLDTKKILTYCWKMIYLYNSLGNDVLIKSDDLVFFTGKLTKNSLKNFNVYRLKLARKIRFMFKRTHLPWDGYYYFSLTNSLFEEYLKQKEKRKFITFQNIKVYKLLDECKLAEYKKHHIFRFDGATTNKFIKFYKILKIDTAEHIIERDSLDMKDLMVTYNKYKFIQ